MTSPDAIKSIKDNTLEAIELTASQKNKLIICVDSTQIDKFLRCEEEWNLSDRQQLTLINPYKSDLAMTLGTLGHHYMERFYKARAEGSHLQLAHAHAINFDYKKEETTASLELQDVIQVRDRTSMYFHFYNMKQSDFIAKSPEHVEVGFSELLLEDSERLFILEGRIDLIGTTMGLDCAVDHKYQTKSTNLYKKRIQFRNYAMVTKIPTFVVNYVRLAKGVKEDTFKREFISFTPEENEAWRQRLLRIYDRIFRRMAYDGNIYEKTESSCETKYGWPCEFSQICEQANPVIRETNKDNLYQIKKEWRPW